VAGGSGPPSVSGVPGGSGPLSEPVGAASRIGPNGTTWADPAERHPGVAPDEAKRLPKGDPRHPDHDDESPRKLWHASGGSAGR
jgi:error-prone DNA polymerase